jgi:hypothetical protein
MAAARARARSAPTCARASAAASSTGAKTSPSPGRRAAPAASAGGAAARAVRRTRAQVHGGRLRGRGAVGQGTAIVGRFAGGPLLRARQTRRGPSQHAAAHTGPAARDRTAGGPRANTGWHAPARPGQETGRHAPARPGEHTGQRSTLAGPGRAAHCDGRLGTAGAGEADDGNGRARAGKHAALAIPPGQAKQTDANTTLTVPPGQRKEAPATPPGGRRLAPSVVPLASNMGTSPGPATRLRTSFAFGVFRRTRGFRGAARRGRSHAWRTKRHRRGDGSRQSRRDPLSRGLGPIAR